ncbi:hypothetical protein ACVLVH_004830 [Kluyvera sp. 1366]
MNINECNTKKFHVELKIIEENSLLKKKERLDENESAKTSFFRPLLNKETGCNEIKKYKAKSKNGINGISELMLIISSENQEDNNRRMNELYIELEKKREQAIESLIKEINSDIGECGVLLKHFIKNSDSFISEKASKLYSELESKYQDELIASLNTAKAISIHTKNKDVRKKIREFYYVNIKLNETSLAIMLKISKEFGTEEITKTIKILQHALSDDLVSFIPSVATSTIRLMQKKLHEVIIINTIHIDCIKMVNKECNETINKVSPLDITIFILSVISGSSMQNAECKFTNKQTQESLIKSNYVNNVVKILRDLPLWMWNDGINISQSISELCKVD